MSPFFIKLLQLIASLSILIVIHEFGHLLFAKWSKTRVESFYLFFNPGFSLFRMKRINGKMEFSFLSKNPPEHWKNYPETTMWGIGWVPLGGYCSIAGMIDETKDASQLASEPQPWEFRTKSAGWRLLIMAGGVLFNFLLALLLYAAILNIWGERYVPAHEVSMGMVYAPVAQEMGFRDGDILWSADGVDFEQYDEKALRTMAEARIVTVKRDGELFDIEMPDDFMQRLMAAREGFAGYRYPTVVHDVTPDSPGSRAGLMAGDSIVAIQGIPTPTFDILTETLQQFPDSVIGITIYRDGVPMTLTAELDSTARIGFHASSWTMIYPIKSAHYNLFASIPAGIRKGVETLKGYVGDFKYVFTKEGAQNLGGFGTIGGLFPSVWNWEVFWSTTAFLSIILAFMNILPIPGLDGGHILFLLVEVVTRRKPSDKFLERAQMVGMIILLLLLVYANGNDLLRWISTL